MVIYITTNLISNKKYIGKDKHNNPNYYGSGRKLIAAINKYGKENFKKEIIEHCNSYDELREREVYWIKHYDAAKSDLFYNIAEENSGVGNFKGFTQDDWNNFSKKCSAATKKAYENPELHKKLSKILTEKHKDPMYKLSHRSGVKRWWDTATEDEREYRRLQSIDWWAHNKRKNNKGGRAPKTILSEEIVREIVTKLAEGIPGKAVAIEYNTTGYMIEKMRKKYSM